VTDRQELRDGCRAFFLGVLRIRVRFVVESFFLKLFLSSERLSSSFDLGSGLGSGLGSVASYQGS
jgi:hypothetical protein